MKRSRFVREQVWPIAVVCFFFVAVTVAAMILAGGAKALAEYPPSIGHAAGVLLGGAR